MDVYVLNILRLFLVESTSFEEKRLLEPTPRKLTAPMVIPST